MLTLLLQSIINGIGGLLNVASSLPLSPFAEPIARIRQASFLGYMSYFFPIKDILSILQYWAVAVAGFYLVKTYLRWMKVIQ